MLGALASLLLARSPRAQDSGPARYLAALPDDHVLGKADAPNIIIDYFSLTCPHCANFHAAVLPASAQGVDRHRQGPLRLCATSRRTAIATQASPAGRVRRAGKFYRD